MCPSHVAAASHSTFPTSLNDERTQRLRAQETHTKRTEHSIRNHYELIIQILYHLKLVHTMQDFTAPDPQVLVVKAAVGYLPSNNTPAFTQPSLCYH